MKFLFDFNNPYYKLSEDCDIGDYLLLDTDRSLLRRTTFRYAELISCQHGKKDEIIKVDLLQAY